MLSNSAILVLLAILVLAVASSELRAPPARHRERRQVPSDQRAVSWPHVTTLRTSPNWVGAVWNQEGGTFKTVTGTFTVPTPQDDRHGTGGIWVGIDGDSCQSTLLQTGVTFTFLGEASPTYQAWFEWYPADLFDFDILVRGGDNIRATATAITPISGSATIENLTTGKSVTQYITSAVPLCLQDAEWIMESLPYLYGGYVTLGNYGTVTFTAASATGFNDVTYRPDGCSSILNMLQHNNFLSSVSTDRDTLTIKYENINGCFPSVNT